MKVDFFKYQGTGNDFVILDTRENIYCGLTPKQISHICNRRFGIGADGLMLLNRIVGYDFEMKYYNANGMEGSMCGNGGRCMIQFVSTRGIHKSIYRFLAVDGEHEGEIDNMENTVRLRMKDVSEVDVHTTYTIINTGSPHFVRFARDVKHIDVVETGHDIRYSKEFSAEGINVNFVESQGEDSIYVRTYERGVEDETLSCGTGVTASALLSAHNENGFNRVEVKTPGGNLSVEFNKISDSNFTNIWLCGAVEFVFSGIIEL